MPARLRLSLVLAALAIPGSAFAGAPPGQATFQAHGIVRDAHFHKPIAGATIFDLCASCPSIAHSDENGRFVIELKDALQRRVQIDAPGYGSVASPIRSGTEISVELALGLLIDGRVVTENGAGVADAAITCELGGFIGGARVTTKTDATGHFHLDGCPTAVGAIDGNQLTVVHPHYSVVQQIGARTAGERVDDMVVKVSDAFVVHGRVTGADRRPVADALVVAFDQGSATSRPRAIRWMNARDDGRFEMPLPKGKFTMSAVAASGLVGLREITVAGVTPADIELPSPKTLIGHVRVGNDALEDAFVHVTFSQETVAGVAQMYLTSGSADLRAWTNAEGDFKIPLLTPGRYWMEVSHARTGKIERTISTDDAVDVEFPATGSVLVKVSTADGAPGSGVVYATVHAPPPRPKLKPGELPTATMRDAEPPARRFHLRQGAALVGGLTAGAWDIFAILDQTSAQMPLQTVEIKSGAETQQLSLTFPKTVTLRGRFVTKTGEPVASAKVLPFVTLGGVGYNSQIGIITDAEGRFTIRGAAGSVQIELQERTLGACRTTVNAGAQDTDIGSFTIAPLPPGIPASWAIPSEAVPIFGFVGVCDPVKPK